MMGALIHSCSDSLDNVEQLGALEMDKFYTNATDAEAEALITSVYNSGWACDSAKIRSLTDELLSTGTDVYAGASTETASMENFSGLYSINYKCNLIIEKLADNSEVKSRVIGEAYFWRAWAFFKLIRGWGTPPLVDHVLGQDELRPANGEKTALWNYVYTSLEEAINRLPAKAGRYGQAALGARITKEAAYAMLGKAYLWAGDNANAVTALSKVIDSDLYDLIDNFSDLYTVEADFSEEYIWEYNAQDDDDVNRVAAALISYSDNWRAENVTMPGGCHLSGFNQGHSNSNASKSFYDFLVNRGEKGGNRQMGTIWSIEDAAQMFITLSGDEYKNSPNYEGNNLKAAMENYGYSETEAAYHLLFGGYNAPSVTACNGYLPSKMYIWHSDMYIATNNNDIYSKANYPGMRYSEVLLLYAEACLNSANESKGLAALNKVRVRAGLDALSSYTLQDVIDEKRAELYGEGERFHDVVRWGIGNTAFAEVGRYQYSLMMDRNTLTYTVQKDEYPNWTGWQDRYSLFPFPYAEIQLNSNLKQNTGWD
jgi:hypothetical protein